MHYISCTMFHGTKMYIASLLPFLIRAASGALGYFQFVHFLLRGGWNEWEDGVDIWLHLPVERGDESKEMRARRWGGRQGKNELWREGE